MTSRLNPYLNFRSEAREALEFYRTVFGGEVVTMTFAEGGMPHEPTEADLLMHGQLTSEAGFTIMASDTPASMDDPVVGTAVNISVSGDDEAIVGYWDRLGDGAEIVMPLEAAPWGDRFGLLNDRFGIAWLFNVAATSQQGTDGVDAD